MEISQDLSFNDYAGKLGSLDDASREMIQKDVARLRERKRLLFPKTTLGIQNVSVSLRNGVPVLKLSPQVFAYVSMEPNLKYVWLTNSWLNLRNPLHRKRRKPCGNITRLIIDIWASVCL
ncbi:MAG: hypothetical protein V8T86_03505 [Victivallis sp.]